MPGEMSKLEKAEAAYNEALAERDAASLKVKDAKRAYDRLLEASRNSIDVEALTDDEIDTLMTLLAKAKPEGSVDVEVNLITQDTEGGQP